MKLLRHQRRLTGNKRKRKVKSPIDETINKNDNKNPVKQRKMIEILTKLADDRANEAFDIILSHLSTRDIYNVSRTNTACRERVQQTMLIRKKHEFGIVSDDVEQKCVRNRRVFGSPDATNYITESVDNGSFNGNTDICANGLYFRQILFWKTKEEVRNTRSDYNLSIAARFLRYELCANIPKTENAKFNQHGFSLRDEYNGECHNQNYSVQIKHSKLRIMERFRSHLDHTKLQPLEEYFITDTMLGDFILVLKASELINQQLVEAKRLFILNLAIQGCSSITFDSLGDLVREEIYNEITENYGIDAFSLQCDTIFLEKMRRLQKTSQKSTDFEITAKVALCEDTTNSPSRFAVLALTKFTLIAPKGDTEQEFEMTECRIEWAGQQLLSTDEDD